MRNQASKKIQLLLAAVLATAGSASASIITVRDFTGVGQPNPGPNHRWNEQAPGQMYQNPGAAAKDAALAFEDNESEATATLQTVRAQIWDLEGYSMSGNTLSIVGGYDFAVGQPNGTPGTLFIKVGGTAPGFNPTVNGTGQVPNTYGYIYAVDLMSGSVYSINPSTMLQSVIFDTFGSNPWKLDTTGLTPTAVAAHSYTTGLSAAAVAALTGESTFQYLKGDTGADGGLGWGSGNVSHNVVQLNLGFLGAVSPSDDIFFSYTMECGNDSLKGIYGDGFFQVPDGGATLMLLGMGMSGLFIAGRRMRK